MDKEYPPWVWKEDCVCSGDRVKYYGDINGSQEWWSGLKRGTLRKPPHFPNSSNRSTQVRLQGMSVCFCFRTASDASSTMLLRNIQTMKQRLSTQDKHLPLHLGRILISSTVVEFLRQVQQEKKPTFVAFRSKITIPGRLRLIIGLNECSFRIVCGRNCENGFLGLNKKVKRCFNIALWCTWWPQNRPDAVIVTAQMILHLKFPFQIFCDLDYLSCCLWRNHRWDLDKGRNRQKFR